MMMNSSENSKANAGFLEQELNQLRLLIETRLVDESASTKYNTAMYCSADTLSNESAALAELFKTYEITGIDWVVLMVTIAAYSDPSVFDQLLKDNVDNDSETRALVGGVVNYINNGLYPTLATAMYLLSGTDISSRLQFISHFLGESELYKKGIIQLVPVKKDSPLTEHILVVRHDLIQYLLSGTYHIPQFSTLFPAKELGTALDWNDLVMAPQTLDRIEELKVWHEVSHLQKQDVSLAKYLRNGFKCLFTGEPGTGKTLVASLLGKSFDKKVLRVDLSMIISKYIGETEKNLSKVFEASEGKDWILFFDEADALFGKRSQTGDAKDRYANQEVSYLLQRVENYDGMVILASNHHSNIDKAFTRRFDSIIWFPKPSANERLQLWTKILAKSTYSYAEDVDLKGLAAKVEVSAAEIANIIRFCTLQVTKKGEDKIGKELLLKGIKLEYDKNLKPFNYR